MAREDAMMSARTTRTMPKAADSGSASNIRSTFRLGTKQLMAFVQ
jgi:hypothetical protein